MAPAHQLRRRLDRALIGGVCAGLADYLGTDPLVVRAAMIVAAAAGGIGVILYPLAWALIPADRAGPQSWRSRLVRWREAAAIAVLTAATLFALRRMRLWLPEVWPLLLASTGLALIVRQLVGGPTSGSRSWRSREIGSPRRWPAAALGTLLVIGAAVLALGDLGILAQSGRALAETGVVVAALSLVIAPYLVTMGRRASLERAQRIRSEERAEMAAHLHDSVLQTLALIQRRADDTAAVVALARRQERELRDWLLSREAATPEAQTLRAALGLLAEEIEAMHAVKVEIVVVGDCALDEHLVGLVAAAREALINAAKFAGVTQIDLYAEATPERVDLFVRDRGVGFDAAQVAPDRQGIRRSIHERMARHGGRATVRSAPGAGTEVELAMERTPA